MVIRQQLYCCARAPFNETKQIFDSNGISQNWIILAACIIAFSASQNGHFYDRKKRGHFFVDTQNDNSKDREKWCGLLFTHYYDSNADPYHHYNEQSG
jgi:hypothetical protein